VGRETGRGGEIRGERNVDRSDACVDKDREGIALDQEASGWNVV